MNKLFVLAGVACALAMSSCDNEVKDTTQTITYGTCNLVTNAQGESFPSAGAYTVFFNITRQNLALSTENLYFGGNNANNKFSTDTVSVKSEIVQTPEGKTGVITFNGLKGNVNNDPSLPIRDFRGHIAPMNYDLSLPSLPAKDSIPNYVNVGQTLVMNYNVGAEYTVQTFPGDALYKGITRTRYEDKNGNEQVFTYDGNIYRVLIAKPDKKGNYKAAVVIYRAKFASDMESPLQAVVLKGLEVKWGDRKYTISGKDIVPKNLEGGALSDLNKFTFQTFEMTFTDYALENARIRYTVAGKYEGEFNGSYVTRYKEEK